MTRAGTEIHRLGVTITKCSHQGAASWAFARRRLKRLAMGEPAVEERVGVHPPQQQVPDLVTCSAHALHIRPR